MRRILLFLLTLSLFQISCLTVPKEGVSEMEKIGKSKMAVIKSVVEQSMYKFESMFCIDETSKWKERVLNDEDSVPQELRRKLAGRDFMAVYCAPRDSQILGGELYIFIDQKDSSVIEVLRGQ